MNDLQPSHHGLPASLDAAASVLLDAYVERNSSFYPEGAVPLDRPSALEFFKRIVSGSAFKASIMPPSTLESRIELFSYSALFAYGAKAVRRFDFGRVMVVRASRILASIMDTNIIESAALSSKMLSIFPWYTVTLLALGLDDMMRQAVVFQQYLVMSHRSLMAATPMSSIIALIAAITRDFGQRLRWVQSVEQLAAGNIPPYYDAYRCQILASDILLQEDGMFPWENLHSNGLASTLGFAKSDSPADGSSEPKPASDNAVASSATNGGSYAEGIHLSPLVVSSGAHASSTPLGAPMTSASTPMPRIPGSPSTMTLKSSTTPQPTMSDEEMAYREHLLRHIDTALLKLPGYPTYVFRDFDMIQRCVEAAFAASKAVTLAVLGRLPEAEPLAVAAMTTILLEDVSCFATVAVIAMVSAMQVIVAAKRTDVIVKGFAMLNACVPEFPRTVRVIYKLAHRLKTLGISLTELMTQAGTDEGKLFSNMNFHNQSVLTPILARMPTIMLPTGCITSPLLPPTYNGRSSGTATPTNGMMSRESLSASEGGRPSAFTVISNPSPTGSFLTPIFPIAMRPHIPGRNPYHPGFRPSPSPGGSAVSPAPTQMTPLGTGRASGMIPASPMAMGSGLDILGNVAASSPVAMNNGSSNIAGLFQPQRNVPSPYGASGAPNTASALPPNFTARMTAPGSPQRVTATLPGVTTLSGGQLRSMPVSSPWDFMNNAVVQTNTWGTYGPRAPATPAWPLSAPMPSYSLDQLSDDQSFIGQFTTPTPTETHPLTLLGHAYNKDPMR